MAVDPGGTVTSLAGSSRLAALVVHDPVGARVASTSVELALAALPRAMGPDGRSCFTLRRGADGRTLPEGSSPRYASIVALGVGRLPVDAQRAVLHGLTARDVAARAADDLGATVGLGDLALSVWAACETGVDDGLRRAGLLRGALDADPAPSTVAAAWCLSALVAAGATHDAEHVARRLRAAAGPSGLFPHRLDAREAPWWRRHVGCFADQVYPVQALARHARASARADSLAVAQACADAIVREQGPDGQWWWHYDVRTGAVVEGWPVYAVHQAGMAPMALMDLGDGGGRTTWARSPAACAGWGTRPRRPRRWSTTTRRWSGARSPVANPSRAPSVGSEPSRRPCARDCGSPRSTPSSTPARSTWRPDPTRLAGRSTPGRGATDARAPDGWYRLERAPGPTALRPPRARGDHVAGGGGL